MAPYRRVRDEIRRFVEGLPASLQPPAHSGGGREWPGPYAAHQKRKSNRGERRERGEKRRAVFFYVGKVDLRRIASR